MACRLLPLAAASACMLGAPAQGDPVVDPPQVFAPGIISRGAHEAAPTFTPDGRTIYFQSSSGRISTILASRRRGGRWATPRVAEFSGIWSDMEPALSPDGSFLVFASSRPIEAGGAPIDGAFGGRLEPGGGGNLWRVDRKGAGWGAPHRLPATVNEGTNVFAPAVLRDGSLLFMRPDPSTGRFRLFRSQWDGRTYLGAVPLPFSTGAVSDVDPAADPDERFIVFGSGRPPAVGVDLFIVRRDGATWSEPTHLGPIVNAPGSDAEPRLSPDGRRLYFSSERIDEAVVPRSAAQAARDAQAAASWNNGLYNIWSTDLTAWTPSGSGAGAAAARRRR